MEARQESPGGKRRPSAGIRRQARSVALQALFERDAVGHVAADVLERELDELGLQPEAAGFARHLVEGTLANLQRIDQVIQEAAPNWPIEQMALVDKNILRLAIFEILFDNSGTPLKAVINEAVELAKRYGGETSSKFVNGVLGTVAAR
ncbi:MAG: transcription antitermination factor NusB [Chloroflexi bacterium]|nr:transcription antitermination factor NusB [Chloroflexota bacterium]